MRFEVGPAFVAVEGRLAPGLLRCLNDALAYRPKGYFHDPRFQRHVWDGWERLLRTPKGQRPVFPAGLLDRAVEAVTPEYGPPEIVRTFTPLPVPAGLPTWLPDGRELRPEQIAARDQALEVQRGLMNLSVSFGKTLVMAAILDAHRTLPALVLVPGVDLSTQVAAELQGYLRREVGYLGGGRRVPGAVTVATPQALRHAPEALRARLLSTPILLVDEVHTVSLKTWFPLLGAHSAPFRIGLSGTVREAHALPLVESFFGPILMTVTERQQVQAGYIARATVLMPWVRSKFALAYPDLYDAAIVRSETRNGVLVEGIRWAVARGWPTLVSVYRLEHGAALQRMLTGVDARWLHAGVPGVLEAKQAFEAGHLPVIIASNIFAIGINLPSIRFLVNGAAWRSELATAQRAGRGLRVKPDGGHEVTILDPYDLGTDILKRHSVYREKLYRRKGFVVLTDYLPALLHREEVPWPQGTFSGLPWGLPREVSPLETET
jgi:superfamily II DNA or RNA helicase